MTAGGHVRARKKLVCVLRRFLSRDRSCGRGSAGDRRWRLEDTLVSTDVRARGAGITPTSLPTVALLAE